MPTYTKRGKRWQAQVRVKDFSRSKTFPTKADAQQWAEDLEYQIRYGRPRNESRVSLGDVMAEYARVVSPTHKGERWEVMRINAFRRHRIAEYAISHVTGPHIAQWRDMRLESVTGATVNRELNLLSSIFTWARKERGLVDHNPIADIRRPKNPPPRDRRISNSEIQKILPYLKGPSGQQVAQMFLLALETGLRLGEICAIRTEHIHPDYVHLPETKNGQPRDVPLSMRARKLIREFTVNAATASAIFAKAVKRAGIDDLTFHDSRHEAVTRLADKLDILSLARMIGHSNINQLRTYYNKSASDIAALLD